MSGAFSDAGRLSTWRALVLPASENLRISGSEDRLDGLPRTRPSSGIPYDPKRSAAEIRRSS